LEMQTVNYLYHLTSPIDHLSNPLASSLYHLSSPLHLPSNPLYHICNHIYLLSYPL